MDRTALLPLLAAALLALHAAADEPAIALSGATLGAWTQDYAAATNAAATDGKPVFLDFTGSDWCGWCMLMEEKVFSKQEWKDWAATNIYLVTLDFPRDKSKVPEDFQKRNRELSDQYGVRGYPTYIVLDSKGEKLGQLGASRDATPAKFIRQLCRVLGAAPPAMTAEFKKLDQSKPLRELGRPPQSLLNALLAVNQAGNQIAAAAEACGVEDAADLLDF